MSLKQFLSQQTQTFMQKFVGQKVYADEEDPVDIKPQLALRCKNLNCQTAVKNYEACVKRIEGDTTGEKNCAAWFFDVKTCVDKCVCSRFASVFF